MPHESESNQTSWYIQGKGPNKPEPPKHDLSTLAPNLTPLLKPKQTTVFVDPQAQVNITNTGLERTSTQQVNQLQDANEAADLSRIHNTDSFTHNKNANNTSAVGFQDGISDAHETQVPIETVTSVMHHVGSSHPVCTLRMNKVAKGHDRLRAEVETMKVHVLTLNRPDENTHEAHKGFRSRLNGIENEILDILDKYVTAMT